MTLNSLLNSAKYGKYFQETIGTNPILIVDNSQLGSLFFQQSSKESANWIPFLLISQLCLYMIHLLLKR